VLGDDFSSSGAVDRSNDLALPSVNGLVTTLSALDRTVDRVVSDCREISSTLTSLSEALQMFGRDEFRPVIDAITIGLEVLLTFVGALTLGIGGVGVMNIMLVSVEERIREIGFRGALGGESPRSWRLSSVETGWSGRRREQPGDSGESRTADSSAE